MSSSESTSRPSPSWRLPGSVRDNGLTLKAVAAVALSIVALVPLMEVEDLVEERAQRQQLVADEITEVWGGTEQLAGPYLEIPVTRTTSYGGTERSRSDTILVFPDTLDVSIEARPEIRHRGIFETVVYVASVTVQGRFADFGRVDLPDEIQTIEWDRARLRLDISDARRIQGPLDATWGSEPLHLKDLAAGSAVPNMNDALGAPIGMVHAGDSFSGGTFRIAYDVAGSRQLDVVPTGAATTATILSPWPSPSFNGVVLPMESEIGQDGFAATWTVSALARGYPLIWLASDTSRYSQSIRDSVFGVELIEEVGLYRKTERSVKYGLLFFAATFLTYLVLEASSGLKLHVIHYGLVGAALCVFYVLLLSLAEVIGFPAAYALSAAAVVLQTSLFTWAIIKRPGPVLLFTAMLAGVYAYLYVLLDLEDLALLGGALGLFLLLSVAMYALKGVGLPTARNRPQQVSS